MIMNCLEKVQDAFRQDELNHSNVLNGTVGGRLSPIFVVFQFAADMKSSWEKFLGLTYCQYNLEN